MSRNPILFSVRACLAARDRIECGPPRPPLFLFPSRPLLPLTPPFFKLVPRRSIAVPLTLRYFLHGNPARGIPNARIKLYFPSFREIKEPARVLVVLSGHVYNVGWGTAPFYGLGSRCRGRKQPYPGSRGLAYVLTLINVLENQQARKHSVLPCRPCYRIGVSTDRSRNTASNAPFLLFY